MSARDTLGVDIRKGDTVTVVGYGWAVRLADTGRRAMVSGFTPAGNVRLTEGLAVDLSDPIARGQAVHPECLAVARRDGAQGHEGNRSR